MVRVLLTGGSGALGSSIKAYAPTNWNLFAPSSEECNISDYQSVAEVVKTTVPNIIIHAAAYVDTFGCEQNIDHALDTNILGTVNMVKACLTLDCKFVYISSEYVFGGDRGGYSIDDRLDPKNIYGKTKAAAEYVVSTLPDYQIIRAPFVRKIHNKAFVDQYSSKFFINEATERIIQTISNNSTKIVHIAAERMSLYELYKQHGYDVSPTTLDSHRADILPKDTSLISNEYE